MAFDFPSSPTTGQTYSVSGGPTYVYNGTAWVVLTPGNQFNRTVFTATAGQTTFSMSYVVGAVDVYRNGVKLAPADFTATNGTSIVLANGCTVGDTIEVISYPMITYSDAVRRTGDTMTGALATTDGTSTTRVLNSGGAGIIGTQSNHPLVVQHNSIERARFSSGTLTLNLTPAGGATTHTFDYDENGGQITLADASGGGNLLIDTSNGTARFLKVGTGLCEVGSTGNACKIVGNGNALVWVTNTSMSVGYGGGGTATIHAFRNGTSDYNNCGIQIQDNTGNPCLGFHAGGASAFMVRHERHYGGIDSVNSNQSGFAAFRASAFNVASDYRIKENVVPIVDAVARLKMLKPSRFNFTEGSMMWNGGNAVDGFLAHEVSPAVPEAVTGEKDAIKDDGTPFLQSLDQAKLVPLLTAALQEAIGRIETLEHEVATLKGGA